MRLLLLRPGSHLVPPLQGTPQAAALKPPHPERISMLVEILSVHVRPQNGRKASETSLVARAGNRRRRTCTLFLMERRLEAVACPKHPGNPDRFQMMRMMNSSTCSVH